MEPAAGAPEIAADPRDALHRLQTAARAFATATDLETALNVVLETVATGANNALLATKEPNGTLHIIAATYNESRVRMYDGMAISADLPLAEALRRAAPIWLESRDEVFRRYPSIPRDAVRARSLAVFPLQVGRQTVGALGIGFDAPRQFTDDDRVFLRALADICALVLDRHLLAARASEDRLRALIDANVIGIIGGKGRRILEANDAFLELLGYDSSALRAGIDWREITPPENRTADNAALAASVENGKFPAFEKEYLRRDGTRVPVRIAGTVLATDHGWWIAFVEDLTADRAIAARADRLQEFAAAMARAATVDAVVREIVNNGGAAVGAHVVNVALRMGGETMLPIYYSTRQHPRVADETSTHSLTDEIPITATLRGGGARYIPDRPTFVALFPTLEKDLRRNGIDAVATIPMLASDGSVIGAIAFAFAEPQPFDGTQRSLLETVADVSAQSLDRARLFERERDAARTLQLALLPAALPSLDDVAIDARYVASGEGLAVGGDWYDVLRFADGRIGLVIGDAAGRGVEAAAFMGKVRHAAAALAMDHPSPAEVLARVNDYLYAMSSRRTMLTCCYVVIDPERRSLRYATAGHPPAVFVNGPGAEPVFLEAVRGVPLGVQPNAVYTDASLPMEECSTLVLYTDGLIERRRESIDVGLERLRDSVRDFEGELDQLCDHLISDLLPRDSEDDVALLVARSELHTVPRLHIDLPADVRRLKDLRVRVATWLADAGLAKSLADDVVVAVNEAASNGVLHGSSLHGEAGFVRISMTVEPEHVSVTVEDDGRWRVPADHHDGRGLALVAALMTDVVVERTDTGTRVRMTRALHN